MTQTKEAKKISNQKYRAKFYDCPCGSHIKLSNKAEHIRSPKHQRFIDTGEQNINLIPITENNNRFRIKCKLPNGESIDIRKRYTANNKGDIKNLMIVIRDDLIKKHYPNRI